MVIEKAFPGVGTRIIVNGNLFRIKYTKEKPVFSFSAEYLRPAEEKDKIVEEI